MKASTTGWIPPYPDPNSATSPRVISITCPHRCPVKHTKLSLKVGIATARYLHSLEARMSATTAETSSESPTSDNYEYHLVERRSDSHRGARPSLNHLKSHARSQLHHLKSCIGHIKHAKIRNYPMHDTFASQR